MRDNQQTNLNHPSHSLHHTTQRTHARPSPRFLPRRRVVVHLRRSHPGQLGLLPHARQSVVLRCGRDLRVHLRPELINLVWYEETVNLLRELIFTIEDPSTLARNVPDTDQDLSHARR